ncbi:MAG: indole-3-glycerol phosphate synthase TrpC [Bdellovibrionales bacterium]|nr:indole-3-glycerol phosphate synthase TrpC [Bdellovibrionales bacterium]
MADILDKITAAKRKEVEKRKELYPAKLLEQSIYFEAKPVSLCSYLKRSDLLGVIAEIKRKSPSKGVINAHVDVERLSIGYMQSGASALSVLTDTEFFGGSSADLETARKFNFCPILRKDFIVDEYQVVEAKSIGADVVLLIAACLEPTELKKLAKAARGLGMEVLMEVHSEEELNKGLCEEVSVVGVNNRNLKDFTVNVETSKQLLGKIPKGICKISESGISSPSVLVDLKRCGFDGFLIGEAFMKSARPERACEKLIKAARQELEADAD